MNRVNPVKNKDAAFPASTNIMFNSDFLNPIVYLYSRKWLRFFRDHASWVVPLYVLVVLEAAFVTDTIHCIESIGYGYLIHGVKVAIYLKMFLFLILSQGVLPVNSAMTMSANLAGKDPFCYTGMTEKDIFHGYFFYAQIQLFLVLLLVGPPAAYVFFSYFGSFRAGFFHFFTFYCCLATFSCVSFSFLTSSHKNSLELGVMLLSAIFFNMALFYLLLVGPLMENLLRFMDFEPFSLLSFAQICYTYSCCAAFSLSGYVVCLVKLKPKTSLHLRVALPLGVNGFLWLVFHLISRAIS